MKTTTLTRLFAAAVLAAFANGAAAQYIWINEKGLKEVSDRPPPISTPQKNILKQPGGTRAATPSPEAPPGEAAEAAPAAPAKTGPTLAEREADFRKRKEEQAAREKKEQEEARVAADKRRACDNARAAQSQLKSSPLIVRKGADGQPAYMNDAQRAQESAKAQSALENCR